MNYPKRAAIADLVAPATALGMMGRPPARLVIEGECTTCGPICDDTGDGDLDRANCAGTLDCHEARGDPEWHD